MGLDLTRFLEESPPLLDLGVPNEPQREVLQHFKNGKRIVLMVAGRQAGKLIACSTQIPTPSGWKSMGDLQPGDQVYGDDGRPTNVVWTSDVENNPTAYRITFDDGHEVLADANHEWLSHTKAVRKSMLRAKNPMEPEVLTTQEMFETQICGGGKDWVNPRTGRRKEANHAIMVAEPVRYPERDLPIDPYVLGVWLGDGSKSSGAVTFGDKEIMEEVRSRGYFVLDGDKDKGKNCWTRTVRGILPLLREMGLYNNKHIPEEYMLSSVEQREELLRGLMDTDGYCSPKGSAEFYSSDEDLAVQVRSLVESLGYKANLRSKEAKIYGVSYGLTYRVVFAPSRAVFHLPRKLKRQKFDGRLERQFRYVHSIEPVSPVPMKCIAVDNESHLYLITDAYIPTHNSHLGARWLILQTMNPNAKDKLAFAIAPTYQMARVIERKLQEVLRAEPDLWKQIKYKAGPPPTYEFPNGWVIEVRSADNPDSLRGPTLSAVWFDEIAAAEEYSFDVIMPTLLANDGSLLGTTTPRGVTNWVYDRIFLKSIPEGSPGHDAYLYNDKYASVSGSTWANAANLNEEAIIMLEDQYGKDSAFGRQEIGGEFVSYEGLVYRWDAHNTVTPDEIPPISEMEHIVGGIDFGWTDPAAAYALGYKDGVWYVMDGVYGSHIEPNDFALYLADLHERYQVSRWYADSARPDLIADLNSRGLPVLPVKKPKIEDRIREMASFTDNNRFKISTRCPDVIREITSYKWPTSRRRDSSGASNPVDEDNHAMDAIGYSLFSVRWLWRNRVEITSPKAYGSKDVDIEDIRFKEWKKRNGLSRKKPRSNYSGLLGR